MFSAVINIFFENLFIHNHIYMLNYIYIGSKYTILLFFLLPVDDLDDEDDVDNANDDITCDADQASSSVVDHHQVSASRGFLECVF